MAAAVKRLVVSDADRTELQRRLRSQNAPARDVKRARIVLLSAEGLPAQQMSELVGCS